ncbi:PIG-L deacetylase family protein [Thioalkalivibrio paradoxus]|uniref:LmbE family protein n=1 Tax=Thioalkalivibrio paradoxus ARh 1 TaxID=713585 RepID=W0DNG3_9GAMM|nr:PIG-L family deacetylase [Thioalkalivibrio paradoxus]AHF00130.1 hypothetical protein THITH_10050 [Thioalkalivibrio paradoxus ARh 1]
MKPILSEPDYLPFQPGHLPDGPWLVLAPHPDDETFGMGGALALARGNGQAVRVLVLTDGACGGEGADLVHRRESETRAAVALLGGAEIEFWRVPDRGLEVTEDLVQKLASLLSAQAYRAVFFPHPGEPHPDHRACAGLAWAALRASGCDAEAWSYEISVQGLASTLVDITPVTQHKAAAMACYMSQHDQNAYQERILGLNACRAWSLPLAVSHAEAFFHWASGREGLLVDAWTEQLQPRLAPAAIGEGLRGTTSTTERLRACETECRQLRARANALEARVAAYEEQLHAMLHSRSWRMTGALRAISGLLRRLRRQRKATSE